MKKLMLVFVVAGLVGTAACNKNWKCECVDHTNTAPHITDINGGSFYHAKHSCNSMATGTQSCSLTTLEK